MLAGKLVSTMYDMSKVAAIHPVRLPSVRARGINSLDRRCCSHSQKRTVFQDRFRVLENVVDKQSDSDSFAAVEMLR